ncbi:hypothetical protein PAE9249_02684 [Paenibacillus sp. CECT 9249]|nr:hypothetical protein PAE9249_02684 [Paenibacillus sp. CECT 9249]
MLGMMRIKNTSPNHYHNHISSPFVEIPFVQKAGFFSNAGEEAAFLHDPAARTASNEGDWQMVSRDRRSTNAGGSKFAVNVALSRQPD